MPPVEAGRARVLLVDDDERNLLAVANVLEDLGEVVLARSGEEALRHLLKGEFAVILLDVYMPGMDGYETAQIIRSREQTKGIPIVFLSAVNKEAEHLMRGYAMGAVDYVFKPVDPMVLRSKVTVFVDLFEKTKEIERKARRSRRCSTPTSAPMPSGCAPSSELRRAEQRQAAIIQSLPMVLYLEPFDANRRVPNYVSGDFEAITGFTMTRSGSGRRCGPSGFTPTIAAGSLQRSTRGARADGPRSNIAGSAPTALTSISSTRRCCSRIAMASPSSSPAR